MPVANYKGTFFFSAGNNGWTESFYFQSISYEEVRPLVRSIATQRVKLMGKFVKIEAIRVSDEAVRGDAEYVTNFTQVPSFGVVAGDRDTPWNVWECRMQSGQFYRRGFPLRGVPDAWLTIDPAVGFFLPPEEMKMRINTFLNALNTRGARLKVISKVPAVVGNWLIDSMVFAAGRISITAPGHGLAPKDSVRISKGKYVGDIDIVQGVYKVQTVAGNTFTVVKDLGTLGAPGYLGEATAQKRATDYVLIDDLAAQRPGWRKTGRAFFVQAGRVRRR